MVDEQLGAAQYITAEQTEESHRYNERMHLIGRITAVAIVAFFAWILFAKPLKNFRGYSSGAMVPYFGLLAIAMVSARFRKRQEKHGQLRDKTLPKNRKRYLTSQFCVIVAILVFGYRGFALYDHYNYLFPGGHWWLDFGILFGYLTLVMNLISPLIIRFVSAGRTLPSGELRDELERLSETSGRKITKFKILAPPRQTTYQNALVTGFAKTGLIVIFEQTLSRPADEIKAIVAHEIGHWRKHHLMVRVAISAVMPIAALGIIDLMLRWKFVQDISDASNLDPGQVGAFVTIMFIVLSIIISMLAAVLYRRQEYEADKFAAQLTDGKVMARALAGLYVNNKADLDPTMFGKLLAKHPLLEDRILHLEQTFDKQ